MNYKNFKEIKKLINYYENRKKQILIQKEINSPSDKPFALVVEGCCHGVHFVNKEKNKYNFCGAMDPEIIWDLAWF